MSTIKNVNYKSNSKYSTVLLKFFHTTLKHHEIKYFLILAQIFSYPSNFLAKTVNKKIYFHFFKEVTQFDEALNNTVFEKKIEPQLIKVEK